MAASLLKEQARGIKDWSVAHRRCIHMNPELSLHEENTSSYCKAVMRELGYTINDSWGYGFTADLDAPNPDAKRFAIRCDMDALPLTELNRHDFVSKTPGAAHMCGHDAHMTIAMTAARLIAESRDAMKRHVRLLFQPSEELPPGGAKGMIEQGCLDGVDEVYGLHNDPITPVGTIRTRVGPLTAAADRFSLKIEGVGCHAAKPQEGLDPIIAASGLVMEWQTLVARRIDPIHAAVLSVTRFHAGTTFNIIPDSAELVGTVRTFFEADRQLIEALMRASLTGLEARGYRCELDYMRGYDSIVNHGIGVERVGKAASAVLGEENVSTATDPAGWGEDFAFYLQQRPGAFYFLGSGNSAKGITEPLHSARFDIDEDCLPLGAAIMAELILGDVD